MSRRISQLPRSRLPSMLVGCAVLLPVCTLLAGGGEPATQSAGPAGQPSIEDRLGAAPPPIEPIDHDDLTRLARRVITRLARSEPLGDEAPYTPASLEGITCRASVTLRLKGRLLGTADSDALPVMEAVSRAAQAAYRNAAEKSGLLPADLDTLGLEVELVGPRERVGHAGQDAARLAPRFEPGIHGVAFRLDGREVLIRPSQLIAMETFCVRDEELDHRCDRYALAIREFQEQHGLLRIPPERSPESVSVWRFRTEHWYQSAAGQDPVPLVAGLRLVASAEVTLDAMRAACADLAGYLRHRQTSDGTFSYEFLPGRGIYWTQDQNWVRQAGTTWVLARYARLKGDAAAAEAAERAIAALRTMVRPAVENPHGVYLHTPDGFHTLGAAALYALALMDVPSNERHADLLAGLMTAIEGMQVETGRLRGHFPPSWLQSREDYYPGEALLAIARYYRQHPSEERRAICDRALPFYTNYFRASRSVPFIPWQTQAWGELARTTRLRRYADFVFAMNDYLVNLQIENGAAPLSIYAGGFDVSGRGRAGMNTGVYLEGLADAIRTADAFGETQRAARYRQAAWRAARFVMQLRFREEECYYVQSPQEVLGGVRNTPDDPTLRIDSSQHALAGLMEAEAVLEK